MTRRARSLERPERALDRHSLVYACLSKQVAVIATDVPASAERNAGQPLRPDSRVVRNVAHVGPSGPSQVGMPPRRILPAQGLGVSWRDSSVVQGLRIANDGDLHRPPPLARAARLRCCTQSGQKPMTSIRWLWGVKVSTGMSDITERMTRSIRTSVGMSRTSPHEEQIRWWWCSVSSSASS